MKKRWLTRRWPEDLDFSRSSIEDPSKSGFLGDQYILESFLRDDNSAVVMKSKIQESFDAFKENYQFDNNFYQSTVKRLALEPEKIKGLPEKELFASLPLLLDHFQRPALVTLANVVTGKTYQRRNYIIKKIKDGLPKLFAQTSQDAFERLQNVKDILRNPDNFLPPCATVVPEKPSSALSVAKCTLAQLENFPRHTLYSMNKIICEKPLTIKLNARKSGGRGQLVQNIKKKADKLLQGVRDFDPLPEPMKKALLVASLSARHTCGEDGGIVNNIGPILPEVIALHNDFLKAISHLQKLNYLDLKDIYGCLSSNDDIIPTIRVDGLRCLIQTFLLEWLFECYDEIVPEPVMRTINMINKLGVANGAKERGRKGTAKGRDPNAAAIEERESKGAMKERDRKGNVMERKPKHAIKEGDPKNTVKGRDQKGNVMERDPKDAIKEGDPKITLKERDQKGNAMEREPKDTIKEGDPKNTVKERDPIGHKTEPRVDTKFRLDTELECVLNVSTHLQQIIYQRSENAGLVQRIAEIPLDNSEDECEPWFSENSYDTHELDDKEETYAGESFSEAEFVEVQEHCLQEQTKDNFPDGELKNSSWVDSLSKNYSLTANIARQIQEVCDEASLFSYRLVGSMMDEFLRVQGQLLEAPARTYLRNGFPTTAENTGEIESSDLQQSMDITILLNTARKLCPEMPSSVLEKVKVTIGT